LQYISNDVLPLAAMPFFMATATLFISATRTPNGLTLRGNFLIDASWNNCAKKATVKEDVECHI
jgi:hypothetical protein